MKTLDEEMRELIQPDGGLYCLGWYVAWTPGEKDVCLGRPGSIRQRYEQETQYRLNQHPALYQGARDTFVLWEDGMISLTAAQLKVLRELAEHAGEYRRGYGRSAAALARRGLARRKFVSDGESSFTAKFVITRAGLNALTSSIPSGRP